MKTDEIINFATWYSGMEKAKVEAAYKKYLAEEKKINLNAPIYLGNQFCKHTFIQSDIQWMKCTCCGQIEPFKIKS